MKGNPLEIENKLLKKSEETERKKETATRNSSDSLKISYTFNYSKFN